MGNGKHFTEDVGEVRLKVESVFGFCALNGGKDRLVYLVRTLRRGSGKTELYFSIYEIDMSGI